jgi:Holliday junction resolvasome RuvABC endonuclease subunit
MWPTMKTEFVKLPKFRKKDNATLRNKRLCTLVDISIEHDYFKKADVVYVERAYGMSRNSQSTLMQLLGAFVGGLAKYDIRCEEINTSTWKAKALQNGRADKDAIMKWAVGVAGRDFGTQDEADALCIAYAGYLIEADT